MAQPSNNYSILADGQLLSITESVIYCNTVTESLFKVTNLNLDHFLSDTWRPFSHGRINRRLLIPNERTPQPPDSAGTTDDGPVDLETLALRARARQRAREAQHPRSHNFLTPEQMHQIIWFKHVDKLSWRQSSVSGVRGVGRAMFEWPLAEGAQRSS
jgi:hypothetical protein